MNQGGPAPSRNATNNNSPITGYPDQVSTKPSENSKETWFSTYKPGSAVNTYYDFKTLALLELETNNVRLHSQQSTKPPAGSQVEPLSSRNMQIGV